MGQANFSGELHLFRLHPMTDENNRIQHVAEHNNLKKDYNFDCREADL